MSRWKRGLYSYSTVNQNICSGLLSNEIALEQETKKSPGCATLTRQVEKFWNSHLKDVYNDEHDQVEKTNFLVLFQTWSGEVGF